MTTTTTKIWDYETDGKYYGDAGDRETVTARIASIYGNDARCQFSAHGAGKHSVQVFVRNTLVVDTNL